MDDHFEFFWGTRIFTTMVVAIFHETKIQVWKVCLKKPTKGYTCWQMHVENHAKTLGVTFQPGFLKLKLLTDATEMKVTVHSSTGNFNINQSTKKTFPQILGAQPFRSSTSKTTFQRSRNDDKNGLQTVMDQNFWGYTPEV